MALRGYLYKKLQERRMRKQLRTIEHELVKTEKKTDTGIGHVARSLHSLVILSQKIAQQNQKIINLLQRQKKYRYRR